MALYPPPSSTVPTFNVDLFSNTIGFGATNYSNSLAFPTAQGAETWTNGIATTTISESLISSTTTAFGLPAQGLSFNYNGIDTVTGTILKIGDTTATGVAIGSSTAGRTPTITIDTLSTLNSNATPAIAIGTSSSTKTIKIGSNSNSVHCSSIDLQGSAINNINPASGAISIGASQTDGILNLGTGASRSGDVNILNGLTSGGSVNIANGGASLQTTSVNIGSGSTTGAVTIGNSANTTNLNSNTISMGSNSAVTTIYGATVCGASVATTNQGVTLQASGGTANLEFNSNNTTFADWDSRIVSTGGSTTPLTTGGGTLKLEALTLDLSGTTINANGTLTMESTKNIVLKSDGTAPTNGTQLGGKVLGTLTTGAMPTSGNTFATLTIVTPGVYLFNSCIQFTGSGFLTTPVSCFTNLYGPTGKGTGGTIDTNYGNSVVTSSNTTSMIYQVVTAIAGSYTIRGSYSAPVTNRDLDVSYFNATRIG
jgi:hypothetical protein